MFRDSIGAFAASFTVLAGLSGIGAIITASANGAVLWL